MVRLCSENHTTQMTNASGCLGTISSLYVHLNNSFVEKVSLHNNHHQEAQQNDSEDLDSDGTNCAVYWKLGAVIYTCHNGRLFSVLVLCRCFGFLISVFCFGSVHDSGDL